VRYKTSKKTTASTPSLCSYSTQSLSRLVRYQITSETDTALINTLPTNFCDTSRVKNSYPWIYMTPWGYRMRRGNYSCIHDLSKTWGLSNQLSHCAGLCFEGKKCRYIMWSRVGEPYRYSERCHLVKSKYIFFHWLYSPLGPWPLIFQFHNHFTDGMTPWTSDQLVARPLPKHRTTQTRNKHIHIPNIHALCGIRTHNPGFPAIEDSTCLRPLGYRDRPKYIYREFNSS
jgi:hypothetical protein